SVSSPEVILEPGQVLERNLTVKRIAVRPQQANIAGVVVAADGQPVIGATVYVANSTIVPSAAELVTTDQLRPTWTRTSNGVTTKTQTEGFTFNMLYDGQTDLWA